MSKPKTISIDGVDYVRSDELPQHPKGTRRVVVVDRGWIFAGNMEKDPDGTTRLLNAVHVLRWESVGFAGMLADPKSNKVTLSQMPVPVELPEGTIIFQCPVSDDWGKK